MKKSLAIFAIFLIGFGIIATAETSPFSYVKTDNAVYYGSDLKMGLFNMKIISSDGSVVKIPNQQVKAYQHNSRLFEYLPILCEKKDTICFSMMEYLTTRSGLKLYRCCSHEQKETKYDFYVFKDNKFYLSINKQNAKAILPFFGIEVI